MIIRIVKLPLKRERVDEFKLFFETIKNTILQFNGCQYLQLLEECNKTGVIFTYSHWNSEGDLKFYMNSVFFKATWAKAKTMLGGKPEAWSLSNTALSETL